MTTIQMAPGANVITDATHGGIDRMTAGVTLLARLVEAGIRGLDAWRDARIDTHDAASLAELAAHDPRVLAELSAAQGRRYD